MTTTQEWQAELERLRYRPQRGIWAQHWDAWLARNRTPVRRRLPASPKLVARMSAKERAIYNEGTHGEVFAEAMADATVYAIPRPRSSGRPGGAYVIHADPPCRSSRGVQLTVRR